MPKYRNTLTKVFSCVIEATDLEEAIKKSNAKDLTLEPTGSQSVIKRIEEENQEPKLKLLPADTKE